MADGAEKRKVCFLVVSAFLAIGRYSAFESGGQPSALESRPRDSRRPGASAAGFIQHEAQLILISAEISLPSTTRLVNQSQKFFDDGVQPIAT